MYVWNYYYSTSRVSNIWPAGHNPAHQAFLSGPRGLREMSKMIHLCLSGVFFSSSKIYCAKTRFLPRRAPDPTREAYDAPPVGWGGHPFPSTLEAFGISIWPPTSLKFVYLALRSKRSDTPVLHSNESPVKNFVRNAFCAVDTVVWLQDSQLTAMSQFNTS